MHIDMAELLGGKKKKREKFLYLIAVMDTIRLSDELTTHFWAKERAIFICFSHNLSALLEKRRGGGKGNKYLLQDH